MLSQKSLLSFPPPPVYFIGSHICGWGAKVTARSLTQCLTSLKLEFKRFEPFSEEKEDFIPHQTTKHRCVFLHETHIRSSDIERLLACWRGQHFHSLSQVKERGVSILISQNIQ